MPWVARSPQWGADLGDISGRTSAPRGGQHQTWATSSPSAPRGEALHPSRTSVLDFYDPIRRGVLNSLHAGKSLTPTGLCSL